MGDSCQRRGGWIPGVAGAPAFTLSVREPAAIPVLLAVPHAGRAYPEALLGSMRQPGMVTLKLEDRLVDQVAEAVARETGAGLLVAHAPRALIDLNRAPDDMDWTMLRNEPASFLRRYAKGGRRARSGLGLVPRRLPGLGEIWARPLEARELDERLRGIHQPYHAALAVQLAELRAQWGAALLLDLHSMPPLAQLGLGGASPRYVLGDRFGASCDPLLSKVALSELDTQRQLASRNQPYAGGYVLDRHGAPRRAVHALQLEICRTAYLDSRLSELGPGFAETVGIVSALVRRLAAEIAALGQAESWPQAAE